MTNSTPIADPKEALMQLFKKAGIKKVAYIDDKFSIENLKGEFIGKLRALKIEKDNVPELDFVDWGKPASIFGNVLEQTWKGIEEQQIRYNYLQRIYEYIGDKESLENIFPVTDLKGIAPEYIETFSPEEWEKGKDTFFAESLSDSSVKVLCLFDMDLNQVTKNGIHYLIETLGDGKYFEQTYCAVFSHLITIGEEFTNKKDWCTNYSIQSSVASKFYPISKSSFNNDPIWGFIEGIKNVLIVEEVEKLKVQSIEIIKNAHKTVIEELSDLTPETYNHIVQRTSNKEGIWEMNTLFRVSNIIQDFAQKNTISNQEERLKFNSSITSIRSFDEVYIEGEPLRWSEQAKLLRNKEIFDSGEIINSLHFPLANGDIFQIGTKLYILLAQPCNLSIRYSGNRDYDYDIASIVEIVTEPPKNPQYFLKVESEDLFVKFQSNYSLKLDVLDLAVFNSDGVCKIKSDQELPDKNLFHYPLELRYNKLKRFYLNCGNKLIALEDILTSARKINQLESVLKPIITLNSALKGLSPKPFNRNTNEFNFGIKRVKRLKEPYSTDALQKFMLYLSRNGFDRDYTLKN